MQIELAIIGTSIVKSITTVAKISILKCNRTSTKCTAYARAYVCSRTFDVNDGPLNYTQAHGIFRAKFFTHIRKIDMHYDFSYYY